MFLQAGCPRLLGALTARIMASPYFGVTTGLNWTLNRQPLGSNASTASSNKTAISAAHRHTASQLGCRKHNNISLLWERRLSPIPAGWDFGYNSGFCLIRRWEVGQTSLSGDYTLRHCLLKGDSGLRAWGWRVSSLKRAGRWYLLCSSSSKTMPSNFKHPVPTYWSSVGTQTGRATPETCRPGWEAWSVPPSGGCCCGTAPRSGTHPHLARQRRQPRDSERKEGEGKREERTGSGDRKWEDEVRGRFQGHKELSQTHKHRTVLETKRAFLNVSTVRATGFTCVCLWSRAVCRTVAAAVAAGLYLSLFSAPGQGSVGNHRGRLSQHCTRNGQHTPETLSADLGHRYLNSFESCLEIKTLPIECQQRT